MCLTLTFLTNLLNFSTFNLKELFREDTSVIGFIFFVGLLLLMLFATFRNKSSPTHKVLALLLVSIITVLFWINETHFLFIYLVYILAFIGAVLMLFLSVVLMLPISTISSTSQHTNFFVGSLVVVQDRVVTLRPSTVDFSSLENIFSVTNFVSYFSHLEFYVYLLFCFYCGGKILRFIYLYKDARSFFQTYNVMRLEYAT